MKKLQRTGRDYYRRFQRLRGDPHSLAGGVAIGVFIGLTPTIPLHTVAILAATLGTRTSTVAGFLSSIIVCNPLTYLPIYYFSLVIGNLTTPYELNWEKIKGTLDVLLSDQSFSHSIRVILDLGYEAMVVMGIGGCLFALPFTVASYYLSLRFFVTVKRKRREKNILR